MYAEGKSKKELGLIEGKALRDALDGLKMPEERPAKLNKSQKGFQRVLGCIKYPESRVLMRYTKATHALSCVMANPPKEGELCARSVLADMYDNRSEGIIFKRGEGSHRERMAGGGIEAKFKMEDGAPAEPEGLADSTHSLTDRSVYTFAITYAGAAVWHQLKSIRMHVASSTETEAIGTAKCGEAASHMIEIMRGYGEPMNAAMFIATDNKANALIGSGRAMPARLKHCMRRYSIFLEQVAAGEVELGHVPDVENPVDFMTKWVSLRKLRQSLHYLSGGGAGAPK